MTPDILSEVRQPRLRLRVGGLWAGAAAIVFAGHVAVAYAVQNLSFETPDGGPPPALAIEMAPLVTAPPLPEETAMLDRVTPDRPDPV
ncbi:MAG: energy transducer TonB, partial [Mesorhizobium sp.]